MKRISNIIFYFFSFCMFLLMAYGVYAIIVIPPEAQKAQEEIQKLLERNQQMAEQRKAATTPTPTPTPEEIIYRSATEMTITGVGDSTMLAALPQLYETFPYGYFDAVYGRTIYGSIEALKQLEASGSIGEVLLFSVGNNSYIKEEDCEELIAHSQGKPTFWISTYGVTNDSDEVMKRVIERHDNAFFIDWKAVAYPHHNEYVLPDGLHPNEQGAWAYANLINEVITEEMGKYEHSKEE